MAGRHEDRIHLIVDAAGPGFGADVGDGRRKGRFESWPVFTTEDTQVVGGFVPFDDEPRVGGRAGADAGVAAKVFLGEVDAA